MSLIAHISSELKPTLKLVAPLTLAFLGQQLLSLVDTFVGGQLGVDLLAGISLGGALYWLVFMFPMGLLLGLDPIIAQALGAHQPARAWRACQRGVELALMSSVFLIPLLLWSAAPDWIWVPDGPVSVTLLSYLWGRAWCLPLALTHICLRSFLQAHERGGVILLASGLSNVLNLFLSVYLGGGDALLGSLFGLPALGLLPQGLGALGIGLATSIVTFSEVMLLAWVARRIGARAGQTLTRTTGEITTPLPTRAQSWRYLIRIGAPIGGSLLSEGGVFCLSTLIVSAWSPTLIAAHQVVLQLASTSFTVCLGLANAICVRVGLAVGSGQPERARAAALLGQLLSALIMGSSALGFLFYGGEAISLLTQDARVVERCLEVIGIVVVFQLFDGAQVSAAAALRGAGLTKIPLVSALVSHWFIGFPLGLYLAFELDLKLRGVWWGLSGGLICAALSMTTLFFWRSRHGIARIDHS